MDQPVSTIMVIDLITVEVTDSLKDVANVFGNIKIRHIPVMAGDTLVGIVSQSDVARMKHFCQVLESGDRELFDELNAVSVKSLMKTPKTISKDQSIRELVEILAVNHFHALPVVHDHRLVGIVTSTDIMKYALKNF
ncbi:CBS domain-containing protein [Reichenbachiella versicolor]|uniref:CBS domain-containing protein n=1 Tax=Reichenbachiella versicolor TaxID=1821036 RepID=UPI000D6DF41C|nr:CBS domain-containing protein [Reichenbachiella versicolor]